MSILKNYITVNYPLAPEKLEISSNMLSIYCSDIVNKYGIKVCGVNIFVPNLRDKINDIVNDIMLQKSSVLLIIRNEVD